MYIQPLNHRDAATARQIRAVLQPAYLQEAALLQVSDLPPLARTVDELQASRELFLGALDDDDCLCGVISIGPDDEPEQLCITMLVVHPAQQRRGIGRALLGEALRRGPGFVYAVSTGAANAPALALYRAHGFVPYRCGSIGPAALALVKLRRPATLA